MNHSEIDDPILTAYALGELDAAERASVEARLQTDAEVRRFVEETRAFAQQLEVLRNITPAADLTDAQKAQILAQASEPQPATGKIVSFVRWAVPLSAAAVIVMACVVALRKPATVPMPTLASSNPVATSAPITTPFVSAMQPQPAEAPGTDDNRKATPAANLALNTIDQPIFSDRVAADGSRVREFEGYINYGAPLNSVDKTSILKPESALQEARKPQLTRRELAKTYSSKKGAKPSNAVTMTSRAIDDLLNPHNAVPAELAETGPAPSLPAMPQGDEKKTEAYDLISDNEFLAVRDHPLSTFSIDVDTASYSNMRRFITGGSLPPKDSVRIEELINYFDYNYPQPKGDDPFSVNVEVAPAPWNTKHLLAKIGLKGREIAPEQRPPLNLVFLLDVSGSMDQPNKLPLVRQSMKRLVERLNPTDRVAIVVYAGASGMALASTESSHRAEIVAAIDALRAGGSTNGAAGIQLAYDIAKANFIPKGANRVILCTDGDFNVGVTNQGDLLRLIEEKAKSGTFLTVLGFGMGNYQDSTLEKLADKGNGNYGYVDNEGEAKKLLVDQLGGTLVTIAKDVKIQVEFNPAQVGAYRLIGYENRMLKAEDFNDDRKDAGEIGAGHTVTALYEITPVGEELPLPRIDPLKYQNAKVTPAPSASDELLTVKLRYKQPDGEVSKLIEQLVPRAAGGSTTKDFQFAAGVAEFGMLLRESPFKGTATWQSAADLAENGLGADARGYRHEFLKLLQQARKLAQPTPASRAGE